MPPPSVFTGRVREMGAERASQLISGRPTSADPQVPPSPAAFSRWSPRSRR